MRSRVCCRLLVVGLVWGAVAPAGCSATSTRTSNSSTFQPTAFSTRVTGMGRPVIFVPGLGCAGDVWDETINHLGTGVEAHVITLAGFAGVPAKAAFELSAVHDQIVAYIDAHHLSHPIIVGHSLGGVLALWLAETDPDLGGVIDVEGLPFLAAVGKPDVTAEQAKTVASQLRTRMQTITQPQLSAAMKAIMSTQITNPEQLDHFAAEAGRSDPAAVSNAMYELMVTDLRPDLKRVRIPVLVVAAEGTGFPPDSIHAVWHAQVDQIPNVDLEFVPGAKHFVMLDRPDAFFTLLDSFLAHHGSR